MTKISVVKVSLPGPVTVRAQKFPRMPRLYLELIENKEKIKKTLLHSEYVHEYNPNDPPSVEPCSPGSDLSDDGSVRSTGSMEPEEGTTYDPPVDEINVNDEESMADTVSITSRQSSKAASSNAGSMSSNVDMNKKLTAMLEGDDDGSLSMVSVNAEKYSKKRDRHGRPSTQPPVINNQVVPPSLAELQSDKYTTAPSTKPYQPSKLADDDDLKRELLFKFDLLRKSYPGAHVPTFTIHTAYDIMLGAYEDCIRRLSLDSSVESYKKYLIYGFMGCEYLLGRFLKLDMEGFTQQQITSMSSYEKLLIELGEKSYAPDGSAWSVELRLLFMIIMNAAFFVVSKMIVKNTGSDIMAMMNGLISGSSNKSSDKKKKMEEPDDVDFDNI